MKPIWMSVWVLVAIVVLSAIFPSFKTREKFAVRSPPQPPAACDPKTFFNDKTIQVNPSQFFTGDDFKSRCSKCGFVGPKDGKYTLSCNCKSKDGKTCAVAKSVSVEFQPFKMVVADDGTISQQPLAS